MLIGLYSILKGFDDGTKFFQKHKNLQVSIPSKLELYISKKKLNAWKETVLQFHLLE